ncbi:NADH:ubiquinone oxidoreductase subunit NDUFA12 [Acetobacteraceae bacterium H6797]|nr:NADH:ubiquinone oxidoreductase subunit NDUFA12 [Acetobacteraceae bacterium H6797]
MSSFFVRLITPLTNRKVGTDRFGNSYFESRKPKYGYSRMRRFVIYKGAADASKVPPEWHAWLHYTVDEPLPEVKKYPWIKEHRPNPTGTALAERPFGHDYEGGKRRTTAGDYEAWTPGS